MKTNNLIFGLFHCAAICCGKWESNKGERSPKSGALWCQSKPNTEGN